MIGIVLDLGRTHPDPDRETEGQSARQRTGQRLTESELRLNLPLKIQSLKIQSLKMQSVQGGLVLVVAAEDGERRMRGKAADDLADLFAHVVEERTVDGVHRTGESELSPQQL